MKKFVFILLILIVPLFVFGQKVEGDDGWTSWQNYIYTSSFAKNVGIGTDTPASKLHVVGDFVLGSSTYWNRKYIIDPNSHTNTKGEYLQITNDIAENGSWDWSQGIILYRGGNVVIGNPQTEHNSKLTIDGNVKINGGSPGMGKVLTSDVNGLASWQQPANGPPTLAIGDTYAGGIIFYLDETGQHGLVVTATDIGADVTWSNNVENNEPTVTNATSFGIYGGSINTMLIIAELTSDNPTGIFAAQICVAGQVNDEYGDWYLPSYEEWELLDTTENKIHTGILNDTYYWSSTEANEYEAYMRWTGFGNEGGWDWADKSTPFKVRSIRKF